ncbi:peptide-binding protein [Thiohalorhabdus methylotrophus]|uniref:Peptide-binding protein n=1 Tax=Thiohalorhabdus methylotrophus TaxID=3242694 RepID=A0ABV4TTL3_9GAMM
MAETAPPFAIRRWILGGLALALSGLAGAAVPDREGAPAHGGERMVAVAAEASNLIPFMAGDSASSAVGGLIHATLLRYDKNLELTAALAKRWSVSEDGKKLTFHLREGVRFPDGHPFTSEDVAFTWRTVVDPETRTPYGQQYRRVSRIETPDRHTFIAHYDEPYAPALSTWASLSILPAHLLRDENINTTDFARDPIGLGPYGLERWMAGQSLHLRANDAYYRGRPYIGRVSFRIIPDTTTQFLELEAGHIDQMSPSPTLFKRTFPKREDLRERIATYSYLGSNYTYLGFNLRRKPFTDIRVRRAIAHAIDRTELMKGVTLGLAERISAPYKPGTRWYPDDIDPYEYDPAQARRMLTEAGWKDADGDGVREKKGRELAFEIITNNDNKERQIAATLIQRRLRQVGIDITVRLVEWATFISQYINKHDFDAVILGWSLSPDPDQYSIWHSSQQKPGQFNFVGLEDPEVDRLLEEGLRVFKPRKRAEIYHELARELLEACPIVYLYAPYSLSAIDRRIRNIEPAPAGIEYNVEEWYIPEPLQRIEIQR